MTLMARPSLHRSSCRSARSSLWLNPRPNYDSEFDEVKTAVTMLRSVLAGRVRPAGQSVQAEHCPFRAFGTVRAIGPSKGRWLRPSRWRHFGG